ncbi:hypothetical protein AMV116 [Betaentomopoxvirus amoorei]|uniref:AMV116 n=1 Tax=Amsacta moorei entomopoxvirus TaxID=28321 RepID=Q9EMT3_AMEPV|nr:hypothetical protein AMV116 [Amsacta moorei entomopoxvirus]AAG02822.1 AMV116 [Amsacta moorei entomopoxvirus]
MIDKILKISNKYGLNVNEYYIKNIIKYNDNIRYCILLDKEESLSLFNKKINLTDTIILYLQMKFEESDIVNLFIIDVIKLLKDKIEIYFIHNVPFSIYNIVNDKNKYYIETNKNNLDESILLYNYMIEFLS